MPYLHLASLSGQHTYGQFAVLGCETSPGAQVWVVPGTALVVPGTVVVVPGTVVDPGIEPDAPPVEFMVDGVCADPF